MRGNGLAARTTFAIHIVSQRLSDRLTECGQFAHYSPREVQEALSSTISIARHACQAAPTAPVPGYKSINSSLGSAPTISKAQWQTFAGFAPVRPFLSVIEHSTQSRM